MTSILQSIGAGIVSAALFIGGIFGYSPEPSYAPEPEALGADTVLPIAGQTYTLAGTGISSTATSFTLTSFTLTQTGYEIQDSDMSSTFYVTFEPGSRSRQELVSCTTVTQNSNDTATISGCTRGLLPITPYTASTTYQFAHAGGTSVVFSNPPQLYNEAAMKNNDETITGSWSFPTPTSGANSATKTYVDAIVNGGTVSYDQTVIAGNAGESFATGTIVYLKASDSEWYKADNDDVSTYADQVLGIAQGPGTDGTSINGGVLTYGLDTTQSGMTAGTFIFLSATAGATSTATTSQILGKAVSATTLFFDTSLLSSVVLAPQTFQSTTTFNGSVSFLGDLNPIDIFHSVYVASTSGTSTFSVPTGISRIFVQVQGPGGAGGGTEAGGTNGGSGGGAGGYAQELIDVSATSSIVYFVGSSGSPATIFGPSSAPFMIAYSGSAGAADADYAAGGAGGSATGGDLNITGNPGGLSSDPLGGNGGASIFGGAAQAQVKNGSNCQAGQAGSTGSGGGGSSNDDAGTSCNTGGAGGTGLIIISW